MNNILKAFWGGLAALTLLWLAAAPGVFSASTLLGLRGFMVQYSGVLAIGCMSVAMILALRPRWPERWLGGLDKMYRLHKWLGIGALVLATTHWVWSNGPKWASSLGLLTPGGRPKRAPIEDPIQAYLMSFRGIAETVGEWTFYGIVLLIAISLVKLIPYRPFKRLHRLLPIAYLAIVFHAVILTDFGYWLTPLGAVLVLMLAGGSYAAVVSLLGWIGAGRRATGTIATLQSYPGVKALEITIDVLSGWTGHKAGQFAFVTSDPKEGAHPYTIASSWCPDAPRIAFVTKALGDHTSQLERKLKVGQKVTVEGPYGRFIFNDDRPVQIWIGGGIGITPFIARMKQLASDVGENSKTVHLFHTTKEADEAALARLEADARAAGIQLHVMIDSRDGQLTGSRITQDVPEWRDASFWFCGPAGFGKMLRDDLAAQGVPVRQRFHQELFEMR